MSNIAIVTDSTSCLSSEVAKREGIIVVPCQVHFADQSYREGVDMTTDELFHRVFSDGDIPETSMPLGQDFMSAFQMAQEHGAESILGIFLGSSFSGTFNGARLAAEEAPLPVELVDSGTTSLGLALLAIHAARQARQTEVSPPQFAAEIRDLARGAEVYAMLDTLEFAHKGGRVGWISQTIAAFLHIKPILRLSNNSIDLVARTRSRKRAMAWLMNKAFEIAPQHGISVIHSGTRDQAVELADQISPLLQPGQEMMVEPTGAALATHTGPNALGFGLVR
jgi:DegV family protein with EDD domain